MNAISDYLHRMRLSLGLFIMCTCKYSAAQFLRSWPMQSNIQKFEVLSRSWEVLDHVAIAWLLEFQCKHFVCSNTITIKLQFHLSFFLTMVNYSQSDLNLALEVKSKKVPSPITASAILHPNSQLEISANLYKMQTLLKKMCHPV